MQMNQQVHDLTGKDDDEMNETEQQQHQTSE
jgi:hypothetical protein